MTSGTRREAGQSDALIRRGGPWRGQPVIPLSRWLTPLMVALALCASVLLIPAKVQAQCPPAVDPGTGLDAVLD